MTGPLDGAAALCAAMGVLSAAAAALRTRDPRLAVGVLLDLLLAAGLLRLAGERGWPEVAAVAALAAARLLVR